MKKIFACGSKPEKRLYNGIEYIINSEVQLTTRTSDEGQVYEDYSYVQDRLSISEYGLMQSLNDSIVVDMGWDEGLQELAREIRYQRMDGPEQSARRKIELGIDIQENQARLDKILAYKQAVNDTKHQSGYPNNVPVWPKEPEV